MDSWWDTWVMVRLGVCGTNDLSLLYNIKGTIYKIGYRVI